MYTSSNTSRLYPSKDKGVCLYDLIPWNAGFPGRLLNVIVASEYTIEVFVSLSAYFDELGRESAVSIALRSWIESIGW